MTVMGMGMVLWEWEGMGTEIVLPAHLYYPLSSDIMHYSSNVQYRVFYTQKDCRPTAREHVSIVEGSGVCVSRTYD